MEPSTINGLLALLALFGLQSTITGAYHAITNTSRKNLKDLAENEDNQRAIKTLALADDLPGLQMLYQYASFLTAILGTVIIWHLTSDSVRSALTMNSLSKQSTALIAGVVILIPYATLYYILTHQVPTAVISGRNERFALFITPFYRLLSRLFAPLLALMRLISQRLGILLGGDGNLTHITEEEIKTLVNAGSEEGVIEDDEKDMIYSVFKFGDTLVREVMVPRIDIVALPVEISLQDALQTIIRAGHSRIPVYEDSIDNIKGFLYAKDLLGMWAKKQLEFTISEVLREPYFVPETKNADELLEELRNRETHIAIVSDEYGGTAGLVTLEDLLEEIVGEIRDEYDYYEEAVYEQVSETEYICSASIDLDDLNELLDISLPTDENDTLGGYIFTQLGKIPEVGDTINAHGVTIKVLTLKGLRRVDKVQVQKVPRESSSTVSEKETEVTK